MSSHFLLRNCRLGSANGHPCVRPRIAGLVGCSNEVRFGGGLGFEAPSRVAWRKRRGGGDRQGGPRVWSSPGLSAWRFAASASGPMETAAASADADAKDGRAEAARGDPIVQYVVVRKDLVDTLKWPLGSVISQGCHAAVAAIVLHRDEPSTAEYCGAGNLDNMHTVTLEVKGETQLRNLAQKLEAGGVAHKLWIEQPEDFPTCLATRPYRKSEVASFFKSLKLCR